MNTSYTFYKDGKKYSSKGANRFEAQENIGEHRTAMGNKPEGSDLRGNV